MNDVLDTPEVVTPEVTEPTTADGETDLPEATEEVVEPTETVE